MSLLLWNDFKRRCRNKNKTPINCSTAFSKYLDHVHDWAGILSLVNNKKGLITQIIYTWYGCLYIARSLKICISDVFLGVGGYAPMEGIDVKLTVYETLLPLMTTFITFPQIFLLAQFVKMLTSWESNLLNILKGRHGQSAINCQWSVIQ